MTTIKFKLLVTKQDNMLVGSTATPARK